MRIADKWQDYCLIDTSKGERLERWGDYTLVRPDPQVIWHGEKSHKGWKKADGIYRSLHYIIKYKGYYVEIQGRTLFEEGWGEVDHDIVYKYAEDDEMLQDYSKLPNRLSGLADEMSSYFRRLKEERNNT